LPAKLRAKLSPALYIKQLLIIHFLADPSTSQVFWPWKAIEHLDPKTFPLQPHYAREYWPLINSVYPLKDGNVLASRRNVSAVIIISRDW